MYHVLSAWSTPSSAKTSFEMFKHFIVLTGDLYFLYVQERACLATGESADELLIRIPGSAYSSGENTISEAKPNGDSPDQE